MRCRKSADFIIGTNVGQRELAGQGLAACGQSGGAIWLASSRWARKAGIPAPRTGQQMAPALRPRYIRLTNSKTELHRISEKDIWHREIERLQLPMRVARPVLLLRSQVGELEQTLTE